MGKMTMNGCNIPKMTKLQQRKKKERLSEERMENADTENAE